MAVVEAGGYYEQDNGNMSVVPAYCPRYGAIAPETANKWPLVDWGFITQPQQGLGGRELHYTCGKTLGGRYVNQIPEKRNAADMGMSFTARRSMP